MNLLPCPAKFDGPISARLSAVSQLLSRGGLAPEKKRLRISPFPAKLERGEILIPAALGNFGLGFNPKAQVIEVVYGDITVAHPLDKMIAKRWG